MNQQRLLLVHWNEDEWNALADELRTLGWQPEPYENAKGLKLKDPPETRPHAVVISLRRLPSHGREVADAIWHPKWAREAIRIVFFDGKPEAIETTRTRFPAATFCTFENLDPVLRSLE